MVVPVNAGLASKPGKVCVKDVSVEDRLYDDELIVYGRYGNAY